MSADPVLPPSRPVATVAELTGVVEALAGEHLRSSDNEHRFTQLQASSGSFQTAVPVGWGQQEVAPYLADDTDEVIGVAALAAPDISRFYNEWDTAGIFLAVSEDVAAVVGGLEERTSFYQQHCLFALEDAVRSDDSEGRYRVWTGCGQADSMTVEYETRNRSGYATSLTARLLHRGDVDVVSTALRRLEVDLPLLRGGEVPGDSRNGDRAPGSLAP